MVTVTAGDVIVEIGDKEYTFSPIKMEAVAGTITDFLQLNHVSKVKAQADAFDEDEFAEMLAEAKAEAKTITIGTDAWAAALQDPRSVVYILWLSLRKNHPDIKRREFEQMLTDDIDAFEKITDMMDRIMPVGQAEDVVDEAEGSEPKTTGKSNQAKKK